MHQSLFCSMDIIIVIVIIIHVFCGIDDQFTIIRIMMIILGFCPQPPRLPSCCVTFPSAAQLKYTPLYFNQDSDGHIPFTYIAITILIFRHDCIL